LSRKHSSQRGPSPADFVEARCRAFDQGDFATIFDSYHPDSAFRVHFHRKESYAAYARETLEGRFRILSWKILRTEPPRGDRERVIYLMKTLADGVVQITLEHACFRWTEQGWRYLWGEKMPVEQFEGAPEDIEFRHFEEAQGIVRY